MSSGIRMSRTFYRAAHAEFYLITSQLSRSRNVAQPSSTVSECQFLAGIARSILRSHCNGLLPVGYFSAQGHNDVRKSGILFSSNSFVLLYIEKQQEMNTPLAWARFLMTGVIDLKSGET